MRRFGVWHPLLFAIFPTVFLFAQNSNQVDAVRVFLPLGLSVALGTVVYVISWLILRGRHSAAFLTSVLLLLTFSYGQAFEALQWKVVLGFTLDQHRHFLAAFAIVAAGVAVFAWTRRRRMEQATPVLNLIAGLLVAVSIGQGVFDSVTRKAIDPPASELIELRPTAEPRDIYYLVPDRYGGKPGLKEGLGFDNSVFLEALRDRGFYVADEAHANYASTEGSLTASLNLNYVSELPGVDGGLERGDLYGRLRDHRVGRSLQAVGYEYIHIGSWWEGTGTSSIADESLIFSPTSEFFDLVYGTTPFPVAFDYVNLKSTTLNARWKEYNRVLFQLQSASKARLSEKPVFVFAHVLVPHDPYLFDADGSYVTTDEQKSRPASVNYVKQLEFANSALLKLIDELQQVPPDEQPIILLQADEGPGFHSRLPGTDDPASRARFRMNILSAYFLPGAEDDNLYQSITPVNSFRLIFNEYFQAQLPLLEDRSFREFSDPEGTEVTDLLRP